MDMFKFCIVFVVVCLKVWPSAGVLLVAENFFILVHYVERLHFSTRHARDQGVRLPARDTFRKFRES